jgi:hypothetical protein
MKFKKYDRVTTYGGKLCLAINTPVLTREGWTPIQNVTDSDQVWDGEEWVGCGGAVCNGLREVIGINGVYMTPDHEVLTNEGWRKASQSAGYNRAESRLPNSITLRRKRWPAVIVGRALRVRGGKNNGRLGADEAAQAGHKGVMRMQAQTVYRGCEQHAREVASPAFCRVAVNVRSLPVAIASRLEQLRRTRDHSLPLVGGVVSKLLGRYERKLSAWSDIGADRQQPRIFAGKLPMGDAQGTRQQHKENTKNQRFNSDGDRGTVRDNAFNSSLQDKRWLQLRANHSAAEKRKPSHPEDSQRHDVEGNSAPLRSQLQHARPAGKAWLELRRTDRTAKKQEPVYDVVNCGPRSRFVVRDEAGYPLIVHNCENVTQAVARDLLAEALTRLDAADYKIVLHVHDEIVIEAPHGAGSLDDILRIMREPPEWADGLPLDASGTESQFYKK